MGGCAECCKACAWAGCWAQSMVVDVIMQETIGDLQSKAANDGEECINNDPLIWLKGCGHAFLLSTMDGHMGMKTYYDTKRWVVKREWWGRVFAAVTIMMQPAPVRAAARANITCPRPHRDGCLGGAFRMAVEMASYCS